MRARDTARVAIVGPRDTPLDPDDPEAIEDLLPEPGAWLDRLLRDPLAIASRPARRLRHRRRRRRQQQRQRQAA